MHMTYLAWLLFLGRFGPIILAACFQHILEKIRCLLLCCLDSENVGGCISDSPKLVYFGRIRHGCSIKSEESAQLRLAVVCNSRAAARALENYQMDGNMKCASAIDILAAKLGISIKGRYLVICLADIRAFAV